MRSTSSNVKTGSQSSVQARKESQKNDRKGWVELVKVPGYQKDFTEQFCMYCKRNITCLMTWEKDVVLTEMAGDMNKVK